MRRCFPICPPTPDKKQKRDATSCFLQDNWRELADTHRHTGLATKMRRVLEYIWRHSKRPGDKVRVEANDHILFDVIDTAETGHLLDALRERGYVRGPENGGWVLTVDGWEHLEPSRGGIPGTCFVAMSFDAALDAAYEQGIEPAVKTDCGFDVIRVDRVEHVDNINDKMIHDIRRAQFMVADFTQHRPGVYFEAGFALGLGRIVIWTCRRDDFHAAHFDTRPYNHIIWETPAELREKLGARIQAVIQPRT